MSIPRLSQKMIDSMSAKDLQEFIDGLSVFDQSKLHQQNPWLQKQIDRMNASIAKKQNP